MLHASPWLPAVALAATVFASPALVAQHTARGDAPPAPPSAADQFRVRAYETKERIRIDGVLDERAWQHAQLATDFVQSEPLTGEPATERTEVRVLYDATTLYIGAYLHDREPDKLVVNDIRKDFREDNQDTFELLLDTFHDRRNGYVFITNVEGARADWQVANEGREINTSWDAAWRVKTRRVADGWTVEMAIPLHALRFDFAAAPSWGINFARRIRRKNELDYWAPVPRAFTLARVSLAGDLVGIGHQGASREFRVKPYALARSVRETGATSFASGADAGVDVKAGVTQGLTLDATVNPDFAQVEADEQQVNLTQFSVFYPEKREFFLENSGIFFVGDAARNNRVSLVPTSDEDMVLFFSRRIGLTPGGTSIPIPAGVRLTGEFDGFSVGALSMQTRASATTSANNYSVLRLRRNFLSGSDAGMIVLSRQSSDSSGSWNRVYGGDANIRFPGLWDWNSYAVGTRTPGVATGQYAFRSSLMHEGDFYHAKVGILQVGEGFNDDIGYFRRTDARKYLADMGLRPRWAWATRLGIREQHPHLVWNYYENLRGQMIGKSLHTGYTFFLNNGGYVELSVNPNFQLITSPFQINSAIDSIPAGGYAWTEYWLKGETDPSRMFSAAFSFITGGLWSGTQRTQQVTVTARASYHLTASVGASHTEASLDRPHAKFEALLWTSRLSYSFTTNMFFDALAQYDPRTHQLNSNLRFNVIHHPLSDLFIVLNEQRFTMPGAPPAGRGLIVKLTQMFTL